MPHWVEFEDGTSGCVDLRTAVEHHTGKRVKGYWQIPNNASPVIMGFDDMPFCYDPKGECKFKTRCPKDRVCND